MSDKPVLLSWDVSVPYAEVDRLDPEAALSTEDALLVVGKVFLDRVDIGVFDYDDEEDDETFFVVYKVISEKVISE